MPKEQLGVNNLISKLHGGKKIWNYIPSKNKLVCTACSYDIVYGDKIMFLAEALGKTGKHVKNVANAEKRQQFMFQYHNGKQFYSDLAKAMVRSNIPLKKPAGKNFCGSGVGARALQSPLFEKT